MSDSKELREFENATPRPWATGAMSDSDAIARLMRPGDTGQIMLIHADSPNEGKRKIIACLCADEAEIKEDAANFFLAVTAVNARPAHLERIRVLEGLAEEVGRFLDVDVTDPLSFEAWNALKSAYLALRERGQ